MDDSRSDLEHQLYELGLPVGERVLELMFYREKGGINGACSQGKIRSRWPVTISSGAVSRPARPAMVSSSARSLASLAVAAFDRTRNASG